MRPQKEVLNYLFIVLGSFIMSLGVAGFLSPNHVATGGTAGLAIVLHHVIAVPVGVWMLLINVPLVLLSIRFLGKRFAVKTVVCIALLTVFVEFLLRIVSIPALSQNIMLATLYGGVCVGVGLGLIFKGGASAGGGTILARIFSASGNVKPGTVVLILDSVVVCAAALVFRNIELGLWSMISIYTTTRLIDTVLVGGQSQKIVHIASTRNLSELSSLISEQLGITGTIVKGNDLEASEHKDIIFLMVDKSRLNPLKQLVSSYDENVVMIVMEASEVLGRHKATA